MIVPLWQRISNLLTKKYKNYVASIICQDVCDDSRTTQVYTNIF